MARAARRQQKVAEKVKDQTNGVHAPPVRRIEMSFTPFEVDAIYKSLHATKGQVANGESVMALGQLMMRFEQAAQNLGMLGPQPSIDDQKQGVEEKVGGTA